MKKTLTLLVTVSITATVSAQDTLNLTPAYIPQNKEATAEKMILNVFIIKNSNNCTLEEFAQLVLGNKYAAYFPPSAKPLKDAYIKKFMKSADFAAFKSEKARVFDTEPSYKKNHLRASKQLLASLDNMGFNTLEIFKLMLATFKKHKLYVTYALFKEMFPF